MILCEWDVYHVILATSSSACGKNLRLLRVSRILERNRGDARVGHSRFRSLPFGSSSTTPIYYFSLAGFVWVWQELPKGIEPHSVPDRKAAKRGVASGRARPARGGVDQAGGA